MDKEKESYSFKRLEPSEAVVSGRAAGDLSGQLKIEGYDVLGVIGQGGLGTVYKAKHCLTGRLAAIKVLKSHVAELHSDMRFQQEAKILCGLSHPSIVNVYDFGVTADAQPVLIMEYVSGITLADLLVRNGPLPWDAAIMIFAKICDALEYAHQKDVVHRDLKPSNVMVLKPEDRDSQIKILDFGIAKVNAESTAAVHLTKTGEVLGSPLYMSPEQCSGSKADSRTDIYSLGCLMYETLTGRPPHTGDNPLAVLVKHLHEMPQPLSNACCDLHLPKGLESIIFRAMEKDPRSRYQSMAELRSQLLDLTDKRLLRRLRIGGIAKGAGSARVSHKYLVPGGIAGLLILVLGASFFMWRRPALRIDPRPNNAGMTTQPEKEHDQIAETSVEKPANKTPAEVRPGARREEIMAALPVGMEEFEKRIAASGVLQSGVQIHASRDKHDVVTIDTTRYQNSDKELKADAVLVASQVVKVGPRLSGLRVLFHHPQKYLAYDEVDVNQQILAKLAASGDVTDRTLLSGLKMVSRPDASVQARHQEISARALKAPAQAHTPPDPGLGSPFPERPAAADQARNLRTPPNSPPVTNTLAHADTDRLCRRAEDYIWSHQFERAESDLRCAISLMRARNDPEFVNAMKRLSYVLILEGKLAESEQVSRELISFMERANGPSPSVALQIVTLSSVLQRQGKRSDFLQTSMIAVSMLERSVKPNNESFIVARNSLAAALIENGRKDLARAQLMQVMEIGKAYPNNPFLKTTQSLLSSL